MKKVSFLGILTSIWVFILPFIYSNDFLYISDQPKFFYVTFAISILSIYFGYKVLSGRIIIIGKSWIFLGLSLLVLYISTFSGVYPEHSFWPDSLRMNGVYLLTHLFIGAFILGNLLEKADWRIVRRSIAYSTGLFAVLTYFSPEGIGIQEKLLFIDFTTTGLTLANATFAGSFLLLGFVITLIEFFDAKDVKTKCMFGTLAVLELFSPFLLFSGPWHGNFNLTAGNLIGDARASSATAILLVLYLIGFSLFKNKLKTLKVYTITCLTMLVIVVGLLFAPGSFIQDQYVEQASQARILTWHSGIQAFYDNPILGWGPENFRFGFYKHFNNDLFLKQNLGEIWFDRAHNVFIDTLVSVGLLGIIVFASFLGYLLRVIYLAVRNNLISLSQGHILSAFFLVHLLQLQTSFNTVTTYSILAIVIGYVLFLESKLSEKRIKGMSVALVIIILAISSLFVTSQEYLRQKAVFDIFQTSSSQEQVENIKTVLESTSDFEGLRVTSASFISGFLSQVATGVSSGAMQNGLEQLNLYEEGYKKYLDKMPNDYRARMNYVYLLLVKTALGADMTSEAREIVLDSYQLSPNNVTTYMMHSLVELYSGNLDLAEGILSEGLAINPNVRSIGEIQEYLERQIASFPQIEAIRLGNL